MTFQQHWAVYPLDTIEKLVRSTCEKILRYMQINFEVPVNWFWGTSKSVLMYL